MTVCRRESSNRKAGGGRRFGGVLLIVLAVLFVWSARAPGLTSVSTETKISRIKDFRKRRNEFLKNHPRSPLSARDRERFQGLDVYPINLKYVFVGKIERYRLNIHNPDYYATFPTNKGTNKRYIRYGRFSFELEGVTYTLQLYKSILSDYLFVPFRDKTNGKETYRLGRYLNAEIFPGYYTIIDFNMAYNPNCAFNENSVCPIPPEENYLPVEIKAGEKRYRSPSHPREETD
ncbi:MAG: DUF1684 domain-containing protein [Deltaproteobacteria bacterium]|nr:DUF1684 domain-containing protein [Deltaproteobacteria bacterium]